MHHTGYFDWAATAPADDDIIQESAGIARDFFANPSSVHAEGIKAKNKLTEARIKAAAVLGVKPETLYFTSGGTEADHIPLLSLLLRPAPATILISAIEHPAVREQAYALKNCGWHIKTVNPDKSGIVTPDAVEAVLTDDTVLVCIMAVNNETGAVQPVTDISRMLTDTAAKKKKRRPKFHVDCVQAAGKIPFCLATPGIDSAAFSAHKIGGPRGTGLLYLAHRSEPFLRGGGQEQGIRSGTENLAGAWALARCLERYYIPANPAGIPVDTQSLAYKRFLQRHSETTRFLSQLQTIPGCHIIPENRVNQNSDTNELYDKYSPWIVQASFEQIPGEVMVRALSERGFFISTGSACSVRKIQRPILEAMGIPKNQAETSVRFSFGAETTTEELQALLAALKEVTGLFSK